MLKLRNQKLTFLYDSKVRKDYRIELHKRKEGEKLSIVSDTMFKAMFQNEKRLMYSCYLLSCLLDISHDYYCIFRVKDNKGNIYSSNIVEINN